MGEGRPSYLYLERAFPGGSEADIGERRGDRFRPRDVTDG
jgi:hypothetical protein